MRALFLALISFFLIAAPARAVVWYDKLPEDGTVSPKADTDGAGPNYSGTINYTNPNPIEAAPEESNTGGDGVGPAAEEITHPSPEQQSPVHMYWKYVVGIVLILVVVVSWIMLRPKQKR